MSKENPVPLQPNSIESKSPTTPEESNQPQEEIEIRASKKPPVEFKSFEATKKEQREIEARVRRDGYDGEVNDYFSALYKLHPDLIPNDREFNPNRGKRPIFR